MNHKTVGASMQSHERWKEELRLATMGDLSDVLTLDGSHYPGSCGVCGRRMLIGDHYVLRGSVMHAVCADSGHAHFFGREVWRVGCVGRLPTPDESLWDWWRFERWLCRGGLLGSLSLSLLDLLARWSMAEVAVDFQLHDAPVMPAHHRFGTLYVRRPRVSVRMVVDSANEALASDAAVRLLAGVER